MVAHKADGTAADSKRLAIKHMDPGAMFNDHNFMKIMMMLGESRLGETRFNGNR
jgi:hypothetical protein